MVKRFKYLAFLPLSGFFVWLVLATIHPELPSESQPIVLYSNQCQDDLRMVILNALNNAERSIHLVVFGLSDKGLISLLKTKSDLEMQVYYDKRSSSLVHLPKGNVVMTKKGGLMHQKILVIDGQMSFIGSTNFTRSSLSMHDNMLVGIFNEPIAQFLKEKTPFQGGHFQGLIGDQRAEIWLLPNLNALEALKELLKTAKKKISISMFTLTNQELLDEIIEAKKRGVKITLFLDYKSAIGASSKAVEKLKNSNISPHLNGGPQLFHHKYACIDDKILVVGSANWTKAAFTKNRDLFLILYDLTKKQKEFLNKLERVNELEAR